MDLLVSHHHRNKPKRPEKRGPCCENLKVLLYT